MACPSITVCICTFRRPALLTRLLHGLRAQDTHGLFAFDVVVVDNDAGRSAEESVRLFRSSCPLAVQYRVEDIPNIARARNRAIEHAPGALIAFIDDDEYPTPDWLRQMFLAHGHFKRDGILGPVLPEFQGSPPGWITKGRFFERKRHRTGEKVEWTESRTGNLLFERRVLSLLDTPFRPEFATAGEDVDFFRRLAERDCSFVWCDEAIVYEVVPPSRCTASYLLRRAALRGSNFPKHPTHRLRNITRSFLALPSYVLALPVIALFGRHVLMAYLIRIVDHAARLLAFAGIPLVRNRQT
jgi:succinoglycan biosynthesis protein ExoM